MRGVICNKMLSASCNKKIMWNKNDTKIIKKQKKKKGENRNNAHARAAHIHIHIYMYIETYAHWMKHYLKRKSVKSTTRNPVESLWMHLNHRIFHRKSRFYDCTNNLVKRCREYRILSLSLSHLLLLSPPPLSSSISNGFCQTLSLLLRLRVFTKSVCPFLFSDITFLIPFSRNIGKEKRKKFYIYIYLYTHTNRKKQIYINVRVCVCTRVLSILSFYFSLPAQIFFYYRFVYFFNHT